MLLHILFLFLWWDLCTILLSRAFRLSDGAHYAESDAYHGEDHSSNSSCNKQTHRDSVWKIRQFSMQCVLRLTKQPRERWQCCRMCAIMFGEWWHHNHTTLTFPSKLLPEQLPSEHGEEEGEGVGHGHSQRQICMRGGGGEKRVRKKNLHLGATSIMWFGDKRNLRRMRLWAVDV